jgi:hypothetical protein
MYCSTQTRYRTIMVDDINLTSPRDLSLAMRWTTWVWVWTIHHLGLGWKTIFSMKWSSCLNVNMSVDCSTQPKKNLDNKPVFHLEILQNVILKVFPYLNDGSVSDLLRSYPRVLVLQIMMIIEAGQWSNRFSIRSLRTCPRVLGLQRLTNNLTVW